MRRRIEKHRIKFRPVCKGCGRRRMGRDELHFAHPKAALKQETLRCPGCGKIHVLSDFVERYI